MAQSDKTIWQEYVKDVTPIHKPSPKISENIETVDESITPFERMDKQLTFNMQSHSNGNPDRIDLHGYTLDRAYEATQRFIARSHKRGIKFITVITGRGAGDTSISLEFTKWVLHGVNKDLVVEVYPTRQEEIPGSYTVQIKANRQYQQT